jgi:hypothetical protein
MGVLSGGIGKHPIHTFARVNNLRVGAVEVCGGCYEHRNRGVFERVARERVGGRRPAGCWCGDGGSPNAHVYLRVDGTTARRTVLGPPRRLDARRQQRLRAWRAVRVGALAVLDQVSDVAAQRPRGSGDEAGERQHGDHPEQQRPLGTLSGPVELVEVDPGELS